MYTGRVYIRRCRVKVAKWGNSLTVRIPADVARTLQLRVGDEVTVQITANVRVAGKDTTAIERIRAARNSLRESALCNVPCPRAGNSGAPICTKTEGSSVGPQPLPLISGLQ
ncbi:AbrB/MazE/SpoVT family DNA-binding domain-containing protein [Devosia nitrariae]|uniref:AbrB/MazE/SpoVT family DNA-binding domain-containing protein n=1 Tax=Devosia nitrariae TaxID=2071872 RepID=UPI0035EC4099